MVATAEDRLVAELRRQLQALDPGARLPSARELSRRFRVSPVTVASAVGRLVGQGVIVTRPGRGTFVAERSAARAPVDLSWQAVALGAAGVDAGGLDELLAPVPDDAINLASGFIDESLLPVSALTAAAMRAARRPGAWARPPLEGLPELRAWFAQDAGAALEPSDVLVTAGGQAALSTIFRAFARRGDPILVESPTYLGALAAARGAGLVPIPVPIDREGIRPDLLEDALVRSGARLIMLQPTYANPHGAVLSEARRQRVLELAIGAGAFIVEDEFARDLGFDPQPAPRSLLSRDEHGHVIYIRSLTKSTAPSLRVAGVSARGPAGERLRSARVVDDLFVSGVLQHTAVELVTSPAWQRHLRQLRRALATRRDVLADALRDDIPDWRLHQRPRGGLCLWVELPHGSDDVAVSQRAATVGVAVLAGRPWFAAEPPAPYLRLSYAAASEERLREGIRRLSAVASH